MEITPENWQNAKALFDAALQKKPEIRSSFLAQACTNKELRAFVENLLASHEEAAGLLDHGLCFRGAFPTEAFAPGQVVGERFRIVRFIAKGGVGEIYEAEDLESCNSVAIKAIRRELVEQPTVQQRFKREVALAKEISHPNVCRVFDIFRHTGYLSPADDILFVSMELLNGETLAARLKRTGRMSPEEALPIISQVAEALEAAHRLGIIHRDLKPGNIILVPGPREDETRAVVTDFGLAIRAREDLTQSLTLSNHVIGTPAYMSPEQVQGRDLTAASDIYSLGLVMYELVTGKRPFAAETPLALAVQRMSEVPKSPRELVPDLAPRWEAVVLKCLQLQPKDRFAKALNIPEALLCDDQPLQTSVSSRTLLTSVRTYGQKYLILVLAIVAICAGILMATSLAERGHYPRVVKARQLTFNGTYNETGFFNDESNIYFLDDRRMPPAIVSVPTGGGRFQYLPIPFDDPGLVDLLPDGSGFLILANSTSTRATFWNLPLDGGKPKRIEYAPPPGGAWLGRDLTWSPDRQRIAYVDRERHTLFVAQSNGSSPRQVFSSSDYVYRPAWSPDGELLRFSRWKDLGSTSSLWETRANGGGSRPLLPPDWNPPSDGNATRIEASGSWTPDGKYYLFSSLAAGRQATALWAVREKKHWWEKSNLAPVQLTDGLFDFDMPRVSRDQKRIFALGTQEGYGETVRYDNHARGFVSFFPEIPGVYVDISRDGKWIAFLKEPEFTLWRAKVDGTEMRQLTDVRAGEPHWSPDGKHIAFLAPSTNHVAKIFVISRDGGRAEELMPADPNEEGVPTWSPDGKSLVFGEERWNPSQIAIHIFNLKTRRATTVPGSKGLWTPRWSPDGRHLLALTPDPQSFNSRALWLYDFQTRKWKKLIERLIHEPVWSHDSKYIYFDFINSSERAVFRIGIAGGQIEKIIDLTKFHNATTWLGLTADNSPLLIRNIRYTEIYALDIDW